MPPRARFVVPERDHPSQQTGNSWKYLYERLPEKRFQQMCGALLAHVFPDITCYPVGQSDGGRDALQKLTTGDFIYQVKWTSKRIQDPVAWLNAAIGNERDTITRLVEKGAAHYYLLTSVAGTSIPGRGSMDRLDEALAKHSTALGIPMTCWWQADLDARVDTAPNGLKWAYPDMLAGVDAIRYVIDSDARDAHDRDLKALLRKVITTQWHEDARVKFKQVELDSHDLSTLFVDVEATRIAPPGRAKYVAPTGPEWSSTDGAASSLGGAAGYLLSTVQPLTLVRGEPGQGKSTLGQYLCQVHRAEFLRDDQLQGAQRPVLVPAEPRLPIRIDLRDYAAWAAGEDPFADTDPPPKRRKRPKPPTLELFLCHLLTARSGGLTADVAGVQDMLERFPMLIVLDGLDEIAQADARRRAVTQIDEFTARLGADRRRPQIVVTTRPNASQLPEPSGEQFETISLTRLSTTLRGVYLRRWAEAQGIRGRDRRDLQRTFNSRVSEPHIAQLADNPMQLTILLYLLHTLGESVPASRTALYTAYMDLFLAREAAKSQQVRENRDDLEEVTAFLGWHLQSRAEADGDQARMSAKAIQGAINTYLFSVDKPTSHVADLFTAVTDRVWALTSKVEGFFEFDVQPLREYFAARFLWEFTGDEQPDFDKSALLRHMVRRPYWLNTSRFYAGFARTNEVSDLVDSLATEIADTPRASQIQVAAWNLLVDGVFHKRAAAEKRAAMLFADDLRVVLINHALDSGSGVALLKAGLASDTLVAELRRRAQAEPAAGINYERMRLAARLVPDRPSFDAWWLTQMTAGSADKELDWLTLGSVYQAAARLEPTVKSSLHLASPTSARVALDAGLCATADTPLEQKLLRSVLDGACSDTTTTAIGLPADLIRLCAPRHFLAMAADEGGPYRAQVGHAERVETPSQRQGVLTRLKARDADFGHMQAAMRFNKGQKATTSPWGNTARAIARMFGVCWLAADIAVIGACTPDSRFLTGGSITKDTEPLGPGADYGRLLQDIRLNKSRPEWWAQAHDAYPDPLSRATWALAMLCAAHADVVRQHLQLLARTVSELPAELTLALLASSSRIGVSQIRRLLPRDLLESAATLSPVAGLLVAHHATEPADFTDVPLEAHQFGDVGPAIWPASHALTTRLMAAPSQEHLDALAGSRYQSRVPLTRVGQVPDSYLQQILTSAGQFPPVWVLAADEELSRRTSEPALTVVAAAEHWLPE